TRPSSSSTRRRNARRSCGVWRGVRTPISSPIRRSCCVPVPEFVALADLLRPPLAAPPPDVVERDGPVPDAAPREDVRAAVRDARLFRARLADAFDDALAGLVRELACS